MLASLIRWCVERRLAALGATLALACYGVYAYLHTPIEAFPDVTNLQVNVIAQMPGLAPPEIERQVTVPLERALNGTPHLARMRSESLFGLSLVYLTFDEEIGSFEARTLVAERMATAELPPDVTPELGPDATPLGQIFQYHLVSDRHTLAELRSEQEWLVAPTLRRTPGVADVVVRGGFLPEIQVELDPARLDAYELSFEDVTDALERASRNVGGGFFRRGDQQLVVRGVGTFESAEDVRSALVAHHDGTPVTVGDVARVSASHTPRQGAVGHDLDRDVVEGVVYLRRGENPSVVLDRIHEQVATLNEQVLPEGMTIRTFYDRSRLVDLTLDTVHHNLAHGALLVVGLVWLFIRSLRGALIVGVVIPLSILTAFIGLHAIHLPANLISMGAIDFGILVDGAVILVENVIHRLREDRPATRRALLELVVSAAVDVARPTAFAMGIIIAALIPVFTLESVEGRIFRPLALTYTFALLGALVFALTVVPALSALAMRPGDRGGREPRFVERLREGYARLLALLLRRRAIAAAIAGGVVVAGAASAARLGTEFLPELDEGDLLVFIEMPTSISLEAAQDVLMEARRRVLTFPEVAEVETQQGRPEDGTDNESVNMAEMPVRLVPRERFRPGWDAARLTEAIREELSEIPGIRFNFSQPMKDNVEEAMSGVRGKVVLKIFGTDLEAMRATLLEAVDALSSVPGIIDLSLYRDRSVPQLEIRADRAALARAGVDVTSVLRSVETALAGTVVSRLWQGERSSPIRVRLLRDDREDLTHIEDLRVPVGDGVRMPLKQLATVAVAPGRASINREANSRSMALKFNVEGRDLGSVIADAIAAVDAHVTPPEGHYFVWAGEFENQQRAMHRLSIVVPLSALVVFGLLFAALGSARAAGTVLLMAPFAMTGGLFGLRAAGINLSVSAAVGFIALLGQVSLMALLLLGAIDRLRREGVDLPEAIARGARDRFRAVLMTSVLAIVGLTPMAVSTAVGSETQRPFAVVLIGGLLTTLLVVLTVLPVVYGFTAPKSLGRASLEAERGARATRPTRADEEEGS
jgi:cobalt-zinc-cadmium resistance protein CzcA